MLLFPRLTAIRLPAAAAAMLVAFAAPAPGASVSLWQSTRYATSDEISAGVPLGGLVSDFFITTDTDLLSVSRVDVTAPLYQHALGSDVASPHTDLAASDAATTADSFITLPGSTVMLGGGFGGQDDRMWGDLSNDGPAASFNFARLTSTQGGAFTGRVAVRGYDAPHYVPFEFRLPAPGDDLALFNARPALTFDYSLDPPPALPQPPTIQPPTTQPPTTLPPITSPPTEWPPAAAPPTVPTPSPPPASGELPYVGPSGLGSISLTRRSREVTATEASAAPASGLVHEFFLTSTTDILSINRVDVSAPLFQHSLGSDDEAPISELIPVAPSLSADSYLTTPGSTRVLGGGFLGTPGQSSWGDFTDDGGQIEFRLGQLTLTETGTFSGRISFRGTEGPLRLPFTFELPGTLADLAALQQSEGVPDTTFSMQFALDAAPRPTPPSVPLPLPPITEQPPLVLPPTVESPAAEEVPPTLVDVTEPPANEPDPLVEFPTEPTIEPGVEIYITRSDLIDALIASGINALEAPPLDVWSQFREQSPLDVGDGASGVMPGFTNFGLVTTDEDGAVELAMPFAFTTAVTDAGLIFHRGALAFTQSTAASETPVPEPTTTGLALSVFLAALATTRRRP